LPSVPFRYFRSGKIFILEAPYVGQKSAGVQLKRRIEYFWLWRVLFCYGAGRK
jgi:hypothetical protein